MVWELSSLIFRDNVESGFDLSKILSIGKNWLYSQGACRMRLLPNSQRPQAQSAASTVLSSSINGRADQSTCSLQGPSPAGLPIWSSPREK